MRWRKVVRFLVFEDLASKGISYSRSQIWRLKKLPADDPRRFPQAVKGLGPQDHWAEDEIDQYVQNRVAARNSEAA
jgi:predicted DNA-binding transcriptional regulator AlpA